MCSLVQKYIDSVFVHDEFFYKSPKLSTCEGTACQLFVHYWLKCARIEETSSKKLAKSLACFNRHVPGPSLTGGSAFFKILWPNKKRRHLTFLQRLSVTFIIRQRRLWGMHIRAHNHGAKHWEVASTLWSIPFVEPKLKKADISKQNKPRLRNALRHDYAQECARCLIANYFLNSVLLILTLTSSIG